MLANISQSLKLFRSKYATKITFVKGFCRLMQLEHYAVEWSQYNCTLKLFFCTVYFFKVRGNKPLLMVIFIIKIVRLKKRIHE